MVKSKWSQANIVLLITILMFFSFSSNVIASNIFTANLLATPSANAKQGEQISFKAVMYNNPDFINKFSLSPGTLMRCWVIQPDFTRVTESIDIAYPQSGHHVNFNFTDKFTIPLDAGHGKIFDFHLVFSIYYPLSPKASVNVVVNKFQISKHHKIIIKKMTPKIVVKSFAYSPAPLQEGKPVNIHITFENKGLGKCESGAKYKIKCDIIEGGGSLKKCPVPSSEMTFGKEILPGKTHSVSLFGATPAEAGKYKLSILFPGTTVRGRPYSIILDVAKKPGSKFNKTPFQKKKFISPGTKKGINPQPEPPGKVKKSKFVLPGTKKGFNPQPEPPGEAIK